MADEPRIPDAPLAFIQRCFREGKLYWTYHVNMRMREKYNSRAAILASVNAFEIIEEYPRDKYLPSYLVHSQYQGLPFHVVLATDVAGDNVRVVTVYRPDANEWESDYKRRRDPR